MAVEREGLWKRALSPTNNTLTMHRWAFSAVYSFYGKFTTVGLHINSQSVNIIFKLCFRSDPHYLNLFYIWFISNHNSDPKLLPSSERRQKQQSVMHFFVRACKQQHSR